MHQHLGLGTCWAGFFEHAGEAEYEPLLELLGVPEDKDYRWCHLDGLSACSLSQHCGTSTPRCYLDTEE